MWFQNVLKLLRGKLRRQVLVRCSPNKVNTAMFNRQGECLQCATCCRLLIRCPFLSADSLCLIYNSTARPKSCALFPLSAADLEDVRISGTHACGYSFNPQ